MMAATPASSKRLRDIERGQRGGLRPAFDRDLAVAGIEADRDAVRKPARRLFHQRRIAHRRGADDHAVDPLAEPGLDGGEVANAAAELHRNGGDLQDALDRRRIDRLAGEGAVEIDHVQIFEALLLEGQRLRGRIAVEHGRARHVALLQAHAQAFLEIDGREQDHGFHCRKFAISLSPSLWLFSGWNWVPTAVSRPTIAVTGPP